MRLRPDRVSNSNEAMRLQPAVMTWIHRAPEKGSGGKWVGSQYAHDLLVTP